MQRFASLAPALVLFGASATVPSVTVPSVQEPVPDSLPASDPAITRGELEHHVRFLAADELGGRAPLTQSATRVAGYLARALEAAGVEPAGENGTFFQNTGLRRHVYPSLPRLLFTDESGAEVEALHGTDFRLSARGPARSTAKLRLRFFYDYNHARMPLTGNPAEAIYFSATNEDKRRILGDKGIASLTDWGLELKVLPGDEGFEPGKQQVAFPTRLVPSSEPDGCELVELRGPLRARFDRYKFTHVQLLVEEVIEPYEDRNVVGRIRGVTPAEHPELAGETVLLCANYDHMGTPLRRRESEAEDTLFNGADDASGCAVLLELAQAFAAGSKPARTLVFLFATSEEAGGVGSQRYLAQPAEPLAKTVAALCLERLGRADELAGGAGNLWLSGFGRTNLGAAWRELGLVQPDPRLEQKFFQRFHAHALVEGGLLAQSLSSFGGAALYGTPDDEPGTLDYAHLEAAARKAFAAFGMLADGTLRPAWLEKTKTRAEREREASEAVRERLREKRKSGAGSGEDGGEGDHAGGEKDDGGER